MTPFIRSKNKLSDSILNWYVIFLDLKLITDLIPNHTSYKCEWFVKSVRREGKYTDYYMWKDAKNQAEVLKYSATPIPPNNWVDIICINPLISFRLNWIKFLIRNTFNKIQTKITILTSIPTTYYFTQNLTPIMQWQFDNFIYKFNNLI